METDVLYWEGHDQCGRHVVLKHRPGRIVSLVPSQSYLLHCLGLDSRVVGITRFCVHPDNWKREKSLVGGTKRIDVERIKALSPDLVIANKEENDRELVQELEIAGIPVWVSDIGNMESALEMIRMVGRITDSAQKAEELATAIDSNFGELRKLHFGSCLYFIWKDPWMAAGGDTFIGDMLRKSGFENAIDRAARYPALDPEEVALLNPQYILLSSEPYPFGANEVAFWKDRLPAARVVLVNGEMFSWYGPSMLGFADYIAGLKNSMTEIQ